jgi:hypothetical protein
MIRMFIVGRSYGWRGRRASVGVLGPGIDVLGALARGFEAAEAMLSLGAVPAVVVAVAEVDEVLVGMPAAGAPEDGFAAGLFVHRVMIGLPSAIPQVRGNRRSANDCLAPRLEEDVAVACDDAEGPDPRLAFAGHDRSLTRRAQIGRSTDDS